MFAILAAMALVMPAGVQAGQSPILEPIVHSAVINADLGAMWTAWTTKEGAESWMVAQAEIDLRVGGIMRTRYDKEGKLGGPGTIENAIISYDPQRMLSIKVTRTPERFPFKKAIQDMWTVVYFELMEAGKTRVTVRSLGFTADPESQQMRAFFDRGNKATLDALVARFPKK